MIQLIKGGSEVSSGAEAHALVEVALGTHARVAGVDTGGTLPQVTVFAAVRAISALFRLNPRLLRNGHHNEEYNK